MTGPPSRLVQAPSRAPAVCFRAGRDGRRDSIIAVVEADIICATADHHLRHLHEVLELR
jgi:hypothetical protein